MFKTIIILSLITHFSSISAIKNDNLLNDTIFGLTDIIDNLPQPVITIYLSNTSSIRNMDEFLIQIYKLPKLVSIFYERDKYIKSIQQSSINSIETVTLILMNYEEIMDELVAKNLGHRFNLFILYWGAKHLPKMYKYEEPLRVMVITKPKIDL